ncbi:hypothetical protein KAR91_67330 [Candidatus Pacearchaeota archaeon]|nr:hypothetical protein [Candidatus Pacearchaeota archaeon]
MPLPSKKIGMQPRKNELKRYLVSAWDGVRRDYKFKHMRYDKHLSNRPMDDDPDFYEFDTTASFYYHLRKNLDCFPGIQIYLRESFQIWDDNKSISPDITIRPEGQKLILIGEGKTKDTLQEVFDSVTKGEKPDFQKLKKYAENKLVNMKSGFIIFYYVIFEDIEIEKLLLKRRGKYYEYNIPRDLYIEFFGNAYNEENWGYFNLRDHCKQCHWTLINDLDNNISCNQCLL